MTRRGKYNGDFEQEWQDAFDSFEQKPSNAVWANIDRNLAYADLNSYKKKAVWYRWASAAILLLACGLGLFQYLSYQQQLSERPLTGVVVPNRPVQQDDWSFSLPDFLFQSSDEDQSDAQNSTSSSLIAFSNEGNEAQNLNSVNSFNPFSISSISFDDFSGQSSVRANTGGVEMYYLPVYARGVENNIDKQDAKYFAGVNVGGGSFEPNYSSQGVSTLNSSLAINPSAFSLASNEAIDQNSPSVREGMTGGESVSLGFNFGINLGKRWVLESGLSYAMSEATTKTNVVVQSSRYQEGIAVTQQVKGISQIENVVAREQVLEYDYRDVNLNNQFQFASVPLQAGYYLIDQKFKLKLNAGVAANFYLGNRLSTGDESIAEVTLGPGADSPYRELSFSGLAGVEVGYNVLKNFDIIVEPNYQQSLQALTKDNASFSANPSGFSILTGIRYNFN